MYQNYILLYCKGYIQISAYKNINVEMKNNTANKITTTRSITSKFILEYRYNILKIQVEKQLNKKIRVLLVIPNVISHTVRVNKIHF